MLRLRPSLSHYSEICLLSTSAQLLTGLLFTQLCAFAMWKSLDSPWHRMFGREYCKLLLTVQWFLAWWHNSLMLTPARAFFYIAICFLDVCLTNWLSKNEQFLLKLGSNAEHSTAESVMSDCYKQNCSYELLVLGQRLYVFGSWLWVLVLARSYFPVWIRMDFHMFLLFFHQPTWNNLLIV